MRKLLLITGDLAAGKSTFAEILSERYQVIALCKDHIKEVLGDTIGFSNRTENKKLSNATMELMAFLFSKFAKMNASLILEANFHKAELKTLHQIALDHQYEVFTLVLKGDEKILYERYLNRIYHEGRHPAHLSAELTDFDAFKSCIGRLRAEEVLGNSMVVPADTFAYQTDLDLLNAIDTFMLEQ